MTIDKDHRPSGGGALTVKADRCFELLVKATDCEVDMTLGRVIIRCRRISVKETKTK